MINLLIMKNLLNCRGRQFRCKIHGKLVEGKIQVENNYVYLCQNVMRGDNCKDKFGYLYSWNVLSGSKDDLESYGVHVSDFRLFPMSAEEIEEYKDWQAGDKITKGRDVFEVIFRSGEVVILKNNDGLAEGPFICDEIYNNGGRLVAEPAPESDDSVELSMVEAIEKLGVAVEKLGVTVEKLRIKKE